jgi:hypothetical protein
MQHAIQTLHAHIVFLTTIGGCGFLCVVMCLAAAVWEGHLPVEDRTF